MVLFLCCIDHVSLRLVDGGSRCAGRVEVYYNGTWATVCDDSWELTDSNVVCEEMNCGYAVNATVSSWFGQGSGPIWADNLKCPEDNWALWQCLARPWGKRDYSNKKDAGIICSGKESIRLVNGMNPCQGRLEVFFNGTWGTVCSDSFNMVNAEVVCAQLNCGSATSVENKEAFGKGPGPIWLDDVKCRLDDSLLWQCPSSPWGQHNCNHEEDVGVICSALQLVAGFDNCSGRVEVYFSGTWGTVCEDSWDSHDAAFVCRQLNCGDPVLVPSGKMFALGNGTIWMDEVKCKGITKILALMDGGSPCAGRLEAGSFSQVSSIICGRMWDMNEGRVLCNYLGCGDVVSASGNSRFGAGKLPVLQAEVHCNGAEDDPWKCERKALAHNNCSKEETAGVVCSDHIPTRLVDGGSSCAGRVEVFYNGTWGTICDDSWDLTDAHLVCLELNCGHALNATGSSWFGQGSGPIWVNNMNCSANSSALRQCLAKPWSKSDCIHKEDAGVICSDHREIRLANGKNRCQGRLEVFFNGTWGTVCSDYFVMENADVVCAQLNCGSATSVENSAAFGEGSGPIWLDDVRCRLDDSLLWQCPSSPWGQHNCNHGEDVGIICSARGIWQPSTVEFPEPFYEEIEIKEFGTRFDSHSVSSVSKVEYYINSDLQESEDVNMEVPRDRRVQFPLSLYGFWGGYELNVGTADSSIDGKRTGYRDGGLVVCSGCGLRSIGETKRRLGVRFAEYLRSVREVHKSETDCNPFYRYLQLSENQTKLKRNDDGLAEKDSPKARFLLAGVCVRFRGSIQSRTGVPHLGSPRSRSSCDIMLVGLTSVVANNVGNNSRGKVNSNVERFGLNNSQNTNLQVRLVLRMANDFDSGKL
ncbi:deleted in malignant brain tumors 1 protein-like [Pristis pectinata]|uniref:deleted in malignant brain tumors 1 protein-like n=1 Tax=Pristis pectinata TaxID=685728 RepID=UPI00223D484F|nr:deleted in malignant brain tumors 1 protein-like [Pristis pectinata]